MKDRLKDKKWFPYAMAACIAVLFYVALTHLGAIGSALSTFIGYFSSVIIGLILAYFLNPLAMFFSKKVLGKMSNDKLKWTLSVILAVIAMVLVLAFMLGTLVPQLAESVITLVNNMDGYLASLHTLLSKLGLADTIDLDQYLGTNGALGSKITSYLKDNAEHILNASASAGRSIANWVIAFILAVYMLMAKDSMKSGALRLFRALIPQKRLDRVITFFTRCDRILVQYIIFSLLDSIIVGVVNGVFMTCVGMQYAGLVSLVVAITNLIPTFGPIVGGVIGAFILLLVKPLHALIFIIFTIVLQFLDGYVLKPKLFGNSLGVSGLLILIAVIVFGKMFGVVGILLAIPAAAILDFVYEDELMPALEKRRAALDASNELK